MLGPNSWDGQLRNLNVPGGCVRLPEWAELPEWTTGMDFYMQS